MNFTYQELALLNRMIGIALMSGKIEFNETSESVYQKIADELSRLNKSDLEVLEKEKAEHTMTLVIFTDDCTYFHLVVSIDDIKIPDLVFFNMNKIPKFDMINEYCRAKYLLEHLQKTKQKVLVIRTYEDFEKVKEAISKSRWSEVFRF